MADSLDTADDRDVTRDIVTGRIEAAATRPGGGGAVRRSPTPHTYEPARIAREGADDAFRRARSTGGRAASPASHRDGEHGERASARQDTREASDARPAPDALDHADVHLAEGPDDERSGDDSYPDARPHRVIRAMVRWSLAIVVTVGLTYLLATQLLEALGGLPS